MRAGTLLSVAAPQVPKFAPKRHVAAVAAGAGEHARVAWETLDPEWVPVLGLEALDEFVDPAHTFFYEWVNLVDPHTTTPLTDPAAVSSVLRWQHQLHNAATQVAAYGCTRRLCTDGRVTDPYRVRAWGLGAVQRTRRRDTHRGAHALATEAGVAAALGGRGGDVGASRTLRELTSGQLGVLHCDLWGATIGAALSSLGESRLRVGLQLAATGEWTLPELLDTVVELAPAN